MALTEKQMKIARAAEPRDKITGEDFKALRKASGGIVKFDAGGEVESKEPRIIELEELAEFGDEDAAEIAKADLFKERPENVKKFRAGGGVEASNMSRGCGAVVKGKSFKGTF